MLPVTHLTIVPRSYATIKELAARYGISKSTLYELIRTDPTFPYRNIGLKKRLIIDSVEFEKWLRQRTQKEKEEMFNLPSANELLKKHKR